MKPEIFPYILITLDVCAAFAYLGAGQPWKGLYWSAAALISFSAVKM